MVKHQPVANVTAVSSRKGSPWLAALSQRVASAFVLIPIVIALVFWGGWVAFGGALLALLLAAYELNSMYAHRGWHPSTMLSTATGAVFLIAARVLVLEHDANRVLVVLGVSISALVVFAFAWIMITRKVLDGVMIDWALTIASGFYLGWPLAFFLLLRGDTFGASTKGFWWLLALFFMAWANDTFALLAGHYFGKHKLAPHISPAKTWEGFVGGLVFTVIAAFVFTMAIPTLFRHPLGVEWNDAALLGVLVAIAATIGDLAESLLKRGTGVKDSGTLVPGHGGLLDRMDSLLFVILVVFFYALFLHDVTL